VTRVTDFRIVREEFHGPAAEVRSLLAKRFASLPAVQSAYLVEIEYPQEHNVACVMFVDRSMTTDQRENLIKMPDG
jgi:hypothetical protein